MKCWTEYFGMLGAPGAGEALRRIGIPGDFSGCITLAGEGGSPCEVMESGVGVSTMGL